MSQLGQVSSRFGQPGLEVPAHHHRQALLVVGLRGAATIATRDEAWAVPPDAMLWLAGDTPHRIRTGPDHRSLILAFPPELIARPTGLVEANGFVHDLVDRVAHTREPARRDRLAAVLVDELAEPVRESARLAQVTELVDRHTLTSVAEIARALGMSERTFRRWFSAEVGTTFTRWHQARLVERAVACLRRGASIKRVAADLGYASPSAFTAMFKRVTSRSPERYLGVR
jgi:AraC-like DNA-binding protein